MRSFPIFLIVIYETIKLSLVAVVHIPQNLPLAAEPIWVKPGLFDQPRGIYLVMRTLIGGR